MENTFENALKYVQQLDQVNEAWYNNDNTIASAMMLYAAKTDLKPFKDNGQATLTEYATELIDIEENPENTNKDWKILLMQNTIGKLHEALQSLV